MYKTLLSLSILLFVTQGFGEFNKKEKCELCQNSSYVNISVNESIESEDDLLISKMSVEQENLDAKLVQQEINRLASKAVKIIKDSKEIDVITKEYYVYQKENSKLWHGSQGLLLKTTKPQALLKIIEKLQNEGLLIHSLNYTLSDKKIQMLQDSLIEKAILKLKQQAIRIAKTLNKRYVNFTVINVDTTPIGRYQNRLMMQSNNQISTTPIAEGGKSKINITVSGTAIMK